MNFRGSEIDRYRFSWRKSACLPFASCKWLRRVVDFVSYTNVKRPHKPWRDKIRRRNSVDSLLALVRSNKARWAMKRVDNAYEWNFDTPDLRELLESPKLRVQMWIKILNTTWIFHAQWGPRLFSENNLYIRLCQLLRSPPAYENFLSRSQVCAYLFH